MILTLPFFLQLLTALALGALIGAEREMKKAKEDPQSATFAGLRTHILVSLIGFCGAFLGESYGVILPALLLFLVGAFFFGAHFNLTTLSVRFGLAGQLSGVVGFVVGFLSFSSPLLAAILAIVTALILALKDPLHHFVHSLSPSEFLSAIKFIIVSCVILPILPKESIDPWGVIVPFEAWLMVVLVSGISFVGYILVKTLGEEKGMGLTAMVGGLASSTATTISLAQQGRSKEKLALAVTFGIVVSSGIMFLRAMVEVSVIHASLLPHLSLTLGAMILASVFSLFLLGFLLRQNHKSPKAEHLTLSSPFRLWPALQFGLLYVVILLAAHFGNVYFGAKGIYIASAISGLADIDAITLSLSNLSLQGKIPLEAATDGITLAVVMNTLVKLVLVGVFGNRVMLKYCAGALGFVMLCGGVAIVFG